MCAIIGIYNYKKPVCDRDRIEITSLTNDLIHRGPDHQNWEQCSDTVLLGGTRLRITDSSNSDADLPFTSGARYVVVFNGQIYNHSELRQNLRDFNFKTQCDTETIVAAYQRWGTECVLHFEGMFAFALYDKMTRQLFCARDPSGQKPFYYLADPTSFVFASEISALIADPFRDITFCEKGLSEYIVQRMILGADTHIQEIKKLEPGCFLTITPAGISQQTRYYKVPIGDQTRSDWPLLAEELQDYLLQSCAQTFKCEHQAALLLSGGIDSTGVLAAAKKYGLNPKTYAIGFERFTGENHGIPSTFDEFSYSRQAAVYFDTDHTEISITAEDYAQAIQDWVSIMGEPLDATEAPLLFLLMRRIKEDGYRLVFSGSGPDEVHDGYNLRQHFLDVPAIGVSARYYDRCAWNFSVDMDALLVQGEASIRSRVIEKMDQFLSFYPDLRNSVQCSQIINFHGRLNAYEFKEMDLTSMAQGIEVRSPLVDRRLIAQAFNYDPDLKYKNGQSKWLYKQAWRGLVPDEIIDRPKIGFPTPMEFWFSNHFQDRIQDALGEKSVLADLGIVDQTYLSEILRSKDANYIPLIYRLYCLCLLVERQSPYAGKKSGENINKIAIREGR